MSHIVNTHATESHVTVQEEDFEYSECYELLRDNPKHGAIVTFTGIVRDFSEHNDLQGIELEQYPKMTLKALETLADSAAAKFKLGKIVLIHRVGYLPANAQIVFVGVNSTHRKVAFDAAQFIMDRLKNDVPLWKKEIDLDGNAEWVDVKDTDINAAHKWE